MLKRQLVLVSGMLAGLLVGAPSQPAQAGPLLDWLFQRPAYGPPVPVGAPYPVAAGYAPYGAGYPAVLPNASLPSTTASYWGGYAPPANGYAASTAPAMPSYGTYYGSAAPVVGSYGYGYLTQRPANEAITTAPAVLPPTAPVTLVPDYRSTASRVPVTYYRPVLTTDPSTGAQVVTLAPCSSYEYQTQRVPTWGLTQVFNGGASLPSTAATVPVPSPTYSLPRGGVPLAGPVVATQPYATAYGAYPGAPAAMVSPLGVAPGSFITPTAPATIPVTPYSSGYPGYASNSANYSTMQPPPYMPPTSTYSTVPYSGNTAYYGNGNGSTGGGSSGTYAPPTGTIPYGSNPSGPPTLPPLSSPSGASPSGASPGPLTPGIYPPSSSSPSSNLPSSNLPGSSVSPAAPSSDPAAGVIPSLPPAFNSGARLEAKPQLQNIVQQPTSNNRSFMPSQSRSEPAQSQSDASHHNGLMPVPVPEDFDHEPRWNPGLLKEKDATAGNLRATSPQSDVQTAWGSKPIRWASLKSGSLPTGPDMRVELPPAQLRSRPSSAEAQLTIESPEVELQLAPPAAAQPPVAQPPAVPHQAQPADQPELRFNVWEAVK